VQIAQQLSGVWLSSYAQIMTANSFDTSAVAARLPKNAASAGGNSLDFDPPPHEGRGAGGVIFASRRWRAADGLGSEGMTR